MKQRHDLEDGSQDGSAHRRQARPNPLGNNGNSLRDPRSKQAPNTQTKLLQPARQRRRAKLPYGLARISNGLRNGLHALPNPLGEPLGPIRHLPHLIGAEGQEEVLVLPAPRTVLRERLDDEVLRDGPEEELLNVPQEELEDAIDPLQGPLSPLDG